MNHLEGDPKAIQETLDEHARYIFTITDPVPADYQLARALLLHDPSLGLRGPDAVDLAITARHHETIYTLDRALLDCANALNIPATNAGILLEEEP